MGNNGNRCHISFIEHWSRRIPLGVPAAHSYNFELAAMYVSVLAYFSAAGAGAYSVDQKVLGGELKFYESLFNRVFSNGEEEEEESVADLNVKQQTKKNWFS